MDAFSTQIMCASDHTCTQTARTKCQGCSKNSSNTHYNNHRRLLRDEINKIIEEQNQFRDTLRQHVIHPESHLLIKCIDEWEKESIEKVQQRAKELRERLLQLTTAHTNRLSQKFQEVSQQLSDSERLNVFIETDLHRWKQILNDLKANLTSPSTKAINHYISTPLIQNIYVVVTARNELFLQASDNKVRIEEK